MHRPSSSVWGIASIAVTLATAAAAVLEVLPQGAWIMLLVLAAALGVLAVATYIREGRASPEMDPLEELKAQLAAVDNVRTWLSLREDPDERLPLDDDRVFQWAKKTYRLIQREFPAEADTFMGRRDAPLGSAYFATAYALRREQMGRDGYLESRADMVRGILRAAGLTWNDAVIRRTI
ncbi:MAG TPA: hypothetical protein VF245_11995 [Solirubrobacterales bacterium]